ncbi:hypothetical protein IQ17_03815 [Bradyrhizobium daqingense]|uniref:Uncharacterized protein n=1 Tax=Bradyrhizobium daqingense TaxID=993502 RepID=A0A562L8I6_9BRAD|nr:hypothetical protein IQ17_03815 [Bradyrhizobium daqingense]
MNGLAEQRLALVAALRRAVADGALPSTTSRRSAAVMAPSMASRRWRAGALARCRARRRLAGKVHSARRGMRPDRADRPLVGARGLPPDDELAPWRAQYSQRVGESAADQFPQRRARGAAQGHSGRIRVATGRSDARDHRRHVHAGRRRRARNHERDPRTRGSGSRSTISAPAIPASAVSRICRSANSRSTAASCATSNGTRALSRTPRPLWASAGASA